MVNKVTVTVVYDSKKTQCEAQCGLDWSSAEMKYVVKKRIQERFTDGVNLEFVDLSSGGLHITELK